MLAFSQHALPLSAQESLRSSYDIRHVCLVVTEALSVIYQCPTILMIRGLYEPSVNVWHCVAENDCSSYKWQGEEELQAILLSMDGGGEWLSQVDFASRLTSSQLLQYVDTPLMLMPIKLAGLPDPLAAGVALIGLDEDIATEREKISKLVATASLYIERALMHLQLTQQDVLADVVNDISLSLTSTLSLEDILDKVSNPVRRTLNVESVSIGLKEIGTGDIVFIQELLGPRFEGLPQLRLESGQGIAGWVADNNEMALVNDVYEDERFFPETDKKSGFQTKSMVCVPLTHENRVIGVLQAINKTMGRFDTADVQLMQAIASPLAIALENSGLHTTVLSEKRRIETIFDNMSEGMLMVSAGGLITDSNDSLRSLLQARDDVLNGEKPAEVIQTVKHELEPFFEGVLTDAESPAQLACDVYFHESATPVPVLISGAAVVGDNGQVEEGIFVFSDLREIREVERMRDDFFHNIVHELRTPLATILMYSRLIQQHRIIENEPERANQYLSVIEQESDRLQLMVRQMLSIAKLQARELQRSYQRPVDMNELLAEIIEPLEDTAEQKGLKLVHEIPADLSPVLGDRETLYSVFKNVIENGIKFTLEGEVRVEVREEADRLFIDIADQGIGISEQALPKLFGRFYRTQTAVEHGIAGTGLGLYMVKEGVEFHGGTITVSSELGKGTTFHIELPVEEPT